MRGFLVLPLAFTGILASLGIFFAISTNDLAGLLGGSKAIVQQANSLRVPSDIDYAVSKYADEKDGLYSGHLRSAWESAEKARQISQEIQTIAAGAKLSVVGNQTLLEVDLNIVNREQEVRAHIDNAIRESYLTLQGLINLIDSDKTELDLLGADHSNFTKSPVFYELYEFLDGINAETGAYDYAARIEANPCSLYDLKSQTICIIRQMGFVQKPAPEQAIAIFNQILGYPGFSLLEDYYAYHKNLTSLMIEMRNSYDDSLDGFGRKRSEVEGKLSALKADDVLLVDEKVANFITGQAWAELSLVEGRGESPSQRFIHFSSELSEIIYGRQLAERVFEQKQDDYLFLATEMVRELNFELDELSLLFDLLQKDLVALRDGAEQLYDRLLIENRGRKTTSAYLTAIDIGGKAAGKSLGRSVVEYSRAVSLLLFVQDSNQSALTVDNALSYLGKTLKSLQDFGIDVSYEQDQYKRLIQIDNRDLAQDSYFYVQELLSKLSWKADFGIRKVYGLREKLASYFADYHGFLQDPAISQKLDKDKIDGLERYFENSLTFDVLSNLDELYGKYKDIETYLAKEFNSIASGYLSPFVRYSYDFPNGVSCSDMSDARILASVRNPSSTAFSNVTLSKKIALVGEFENPVVFRIERVGPGETWFKEFIARVWYNCSENYSLDRTQVEKSLFEIGNRMAQLCLFWNCTGLKKAYHEAQSSMDLSLIQGKFEEEINRFLESFTGKDVRKKLESIGISLKEFSKAVDGAGLEHNSTLLYSGRDYSEANAAYKRLKSVYDLLSPLSSKSASERFDELIKKFPLLDIADFLDDVYALNDYLNHSLDSLRNEAKAGLLSAKERFEAEGAGLDYLKKAMDAYNSGKYNRAIVLSGMALAETGTEGFDFASLAYLSVAAALSLFCLFLVRRPRQDRKIVRRLLRPIS